MSYCRLTNSIGGLLVDQSIGTSESWSFGFLLEPPLFQPQQRMQQPIFCQEREHKDINFEKLVP